MTPAPPPTPRQVRSYVHHLVTYDVFPEFSGHVRRLLYNPLGVLLLAALTALLCGLFLHPQGFVLLGGITAVVALGVCWPWATTRGLSGHISFDRRRAREGDAVEATLALRNRLPWPALGLVVRGFAADPSLASLPGRRHVRCRWTFVPTRRGVYPLAAPRLATGFPFGLWQASVPLAVETPLVVWPRTYPVGPVPPASGDRQVEGSVSRNTVGSTGDVVGVRPYRRGDSPRRIHWGQSARHDRLIVCELQANHRPVVQLVLDADPRAHFGDSREWAIRAVASLAEGWLAEGAQVGLVAAGEVIPPASGTSQTHKILDALARLPDEAGASLPETLRHPACRGFRDGVQVVVTTDLGAAPRPPAEAHQRWVVLRSSPAPLPLRPWLAVDHLEDLPRLLRGGWKEARHGT